MQAQITHSNIKNAFFDKLSESSADGPFDALVCPAAPLPAAPIPLTHDCSVISNFYLSFFNLLGFPSGTVPVTVVEEGEDRWDPVRDAN